MKREHIEEDAREPLPSEEWAQILEELKGQETRNYFEEVVEELLYPLQKNIEATLTQRPDLYLLEVKDLLEQAYLIAKEGRKLSGDDPRYQPLKDRLGEILANAKVRVDTSSLADKRGVLKLIFERHGFKDSGFKDAKQFPRAPFSMVNPDEGREHPTIH